LNELEDVTVRTTNALDDAIETLQRESSAWQGVLQNTMGKLTEDAQSTVRNEIANVLSRTVAQAGVQFRCDVDFVGRRVLQALVRIRAKVLGEQLPPVEPVLCDVVPLAVDRSLVPQRISQLEFYGYDFDLTDTLRVVLLKTGGGEADVTGHLDRPTHYAMTLKFGASGVQLDDASERFVLKWDGREISTIAVIQPETPVCATKVERFQPGKITYVPPHVRGDREFKGHGPKVTASVALDVGPSSIQARVSMNAKETKKDWTTASGTKNVVIYNAPPGWRIERVVGGLASTFSYEDSDLTLDSFELGSGGPVQRFVFTGDTGGSEAGTRTQVDVSFNELSIELVETGDCVSPDRLVEAGSRGSISDMALRRLEPALGAERLRRLTGR
jgi:hypothetical protein